MLRSSSCRCAHGALRLDVAPQSARARQATSAAATMTTPTTPTTRTNSLGLGRPIANQRRRRGVLVVVAATRPPPPGSPGDVDVRIRSEVEAPFRTVRLVLFGFFAGSAGVGAAIAATQVLGALVRSSTGGDASGGGGGISLSDAATSLAIDLGAVALFAFLFSRDWRAREKQIARLQREADLGALRIKLASGARKRLASLRGFSRPVVVAGTREQVEAAVEAAEPHREALEARGVLIVPVPFLGGGGGGGGEVGGREGEASTSTSSTSSSTSSTSSSSSSSKDDLRWKAEALDSPAWKRWFEEQARIAGASVDKGLYVGLRIDGRVRASGTGVPPWAAFAVQLPPMEGVFKGFGDGFDGRV